MEIIKVNKKEYIILMVNLIFALLLFCGAWSAVIISTFASTETLLTSIQKSIVVSLAFGFIIYWFLGFNSISPLIEWLPETNQFRVKFLYKTTNWMPVTNIEIIPIERRIIRTRKKVVATYEGEGVGIFPSFHIISKLFVVSSLRKQQHPLIFKKTSNNVLFITTLKKMQDSLKTEPSK